MALVFGEIRHNRMKRAPQRWQVEFVLVEGDKFNTIKVAYIMIWSFEIILCISSSNMGLMLGVPHELLAKTLDENPELNNRVYPYCRLNPRVFFDLGFKTGVPLGRVEVRLDRLRSPKLVEHFVALCRGDYRQDGRYLTFEDTRVFGIIKGDGVLLAGDIHNGNGTMSTFNLGGIDVEAPDPETKLFPNGSLVMLPFPTDPRRYGSQFYFNIGTQKEVHDGAVLGEITEGREILEELMRFSTPSGVPSVDVYIKKSGQL